MKAIYYPLVFLFALAPLHAAGDQLTGFPFQNETLHYNVNWASGLSLGDLILTAAKTDGGGWALSADLDVGIPGLPIRDKYKSSMTGEYCSTELNRELSRGAKKNTEKTTFDQKGGHGVRQTLFPLGGGKTDFDIPACAKDVLAYLYFARKELGQGRVPPAGKLYFGGEYEVRMDYTGAQTIPVGGKPTITDHLNVSVKGPASKTTFEMFFARDAARTPLLVKIPVSVGNLSVELAR
jgi:hypothetical protein